MILHIFNKANQEIRSIDIASPATSCETKKSFICIPITQNDLTLAGTKLCIRFDIPVIDIQGYWMPAMKRPLIRHKWIINQNSACQVHFPYFTFLRTDQKNAATFALSCVYDDVQIFAKMNQERCCYCCEI